MKLSALLSPAMRELIERLRPHLDVTVELFDASLTPLLSERRDSTSILLRRLLDEEWASDHSVPDRVDVRERALTAMSTASPQIFLCGGLRIACFPVRRERTVVGLLTAADLAFADALTPWSDAPEGGDGAGGRLERLCWHLRTTIESDLDVHGQLAHESRQTRWLSTTLRFFEHLGACDTEAELSERLTQAVAIWGDVEARLYQRAEPDTFHLHTSLPAVSRTPPPVTLPATVVDGHEGPVRVTSIAELEQLGFGPHGEVLFLPIRGRQRRAEWLLVTGGAVDATFEQVLSVACGCAAFSFADMSVRRLEGLRQRLHQRLVGGSNVPAKLAGALLELASAIRATRARLIVIPSVDGPPLTLAEIGGRTLAPAAESHGGLPLRWTINVDVGLPSPAALEFETRSAAGSADRQLVADAAATFGIWLAGALHGLAAARHDLQAGHVADGFEGRVRQELERARRFGLAAGVVVIDRPAIAPTPPEGAADPVADAVRGELRASDVLGRLSGGELAALLVQADAEGVGAVTSRLASRLSSLSGDLRSATLAGTLGAASYPSAGETVQALMSAAREDQRRRSDGRRAGRVS